MIKLTFFSIWIEAFLIVECVPVIGFKPFYTFLAFCDKSFFSGVSVDHAFTSATCITME